MTQVTLTSECYGFSRANLCTAPARNTVPPHPRRRVRPRVRDDLRCFLGRRNRLEKRTGILGIPRTCNAHSTPGPKCPVAPTGSRLLRRRKNGAQRRDTVATRRAPHVNSPVELRPHGT